MSVTATKKYSVFVKTWAEVIGDAMHRLKFVQTSLNYTSSHDEGIKYMQEKHAEFLPDALATDDGDIDQVQESA